MYSLIILFSINVSNVSMASQQISGFKDLPTCQAAQHQMQVMRPLIALSYSDGTSAPAGLGVTQAVCVKVQ